MLKDIIYVVCVISYPVYFHLLFMVYVTGKHTSELTIILINHLTINLIYTQLSRSPLCSHYGLCYI